MFRNLLRHTFSRQAGATIFRVQVQLRHGRRSGSVDKMKSPLITSCPSDVGFTSSVKAIQSCKGSLQGYASIEERGSWEPRITPDLAEFSSAKRIGLGLELPAAYPAALRSGGGEFDAGRARQAH